MELTEHSFAAKLTVEGVAMPPVPAGVARTILSILVSGGGADEFNPDYFSAELTRDGTDFEFTSPLAVIRDHGQRSGAAHIGILEPGDVLTLFASAPDKITAFVNYHDRVVS
ncbi:hypothetical protein [Epibacterium ulvae]|uniref:hypothetical protein n=1 Tax=Epibacterium ulvae TaxID=1156985 RepID=UPI0024922550|nr:hypothetical protein [Epibacterium ulvae]